MRPRVQFQERQEGREEREGKGERTGVGGVKERGKEENELMKNSKQSN